MRSIMVATDFSERSDRALRRATLLARQHGAELSIVHVVDDDQPRRIVDGEQDMARALFRDLQATVRNVDGLACETRVVLGAPFSGIAEAAKAAGPDILVVGPHRRAVLRDVFVGTTAERTIRSVACPVLMVNAPPVGPYRHILLTTDLSEAAKQAIQKFGALEMHARARTSIIHVFDAPALNLAMSKSMADGSREDYLEDEGRAAASELSTFVNALDLGIMKQIVRHDKTAPAHDILDASKADGVDLIVVGTHGRSGLSKFFLGSVVAEVLRHADKDVLAIPPVRDA